jgi:hypothetical protein
VDQQKSLDVADGMVDAAGILASRAACANDKFSEARFHQRSGVEEGQISRARTRTCKSAAACMRGKGKVENRERDPRPHQDKSDGDAVSR